MLIPDEAIGTDQASKFVLVVGEDGAVARKIVTLGPLHDGPARRARGPAPDDWVITKGLQRARPGQKVAPTRTEIQASAEPLSPSSSRRRSMARRCQVRRSQRPSRRRRRPRSKSRPAMRLSRFFIDRPDLRGGAVDLRHHHRCDRLSRLSDYPVSRDYAADNHRVGDLSRRQRADRRRYRCRRDRAGDQRRRRACSTCIPSRPTTAAVGITVSFEIGTDIDKAQVLVQNRVASAEPRLPEEVRRNGVTVRKNSPDILTRRAPGVARQQLRSGLHLELRRCSTCATCSRASRASAPC